MHPVFQFVGLSVENGFGSRRTFTSKGIGQFADFFGQQGRVINNDFTGRGHNHLFQDIVRPALGFRVKERKSINFVPPEFHSDRQRRAGSKEIENSAPSGKLARSFNLVCPFIAAAYEQLYHLFRAHLVGGMEGTGAGLQNIRR